MRVSARTDEALGDLMFYLSQYNFKIVYAQGKDVGKIWHFIWFLLGLLHPLRSSSTRLTNPLQLCIKMITVNHQYSGSNTRTQQSFGNIKLLWKTYYIRNWIKSAAERRAVKSTRYFASHRIRYTVHQNPCVFISWVVIVYVPTDPASSNTWNIRKPTHHRHRAVSVSSTDELTGIDPSSLQKSAREPSKIKQLNFPPNIRYQHESLALSLLCSNSSVYCAPNWKLSSDHQQRKSIYSLPYVAARKTWINLRQNLLL